MALNTTRSSNGNSGRNFVNSTVNSTKTDNNLRSLSDDPRVDKHTNIKVVKRTGGGRNTESFDPKSTLVRPDMRILIAPNQPVLDQVIKHDDVIIVPDFFCKQDDWELYYQLVEEMRVAQAAKVDKSEWISWHEGAHLISNNPSESKAFQDIQKKISTYFGINNHKVGTRFNWYRDSSDWKPFHHDSAAYNPGRARNQNITVGVSFGATRELSFLNAKNGTRIYFPQTNGMMFAFGRDVNINWKHGINALPEEEQDGKGRISIVLWGLSPKFTEEEGSPGMLLDNSGGGGHNMHNGHGHNSSRNNAAGGGRGSGGGRRGNSRERRPTHNTGHDDDRQNNESRKSNFNNDRREPYRRDESNRQDRQDRQPQQRVSGINGDGADNRGRSRADSRDRDHRRADNRNNIGGGGGGDGRSGERGDDRTSRDRSRDRV